ncbi:RimK family alpha-L-glutamate ligase [Qipengyuania sp. DSG2-2]|uniref:ATP-grasp domain-containing protein n=1 Tax=Qipengyuania sp. DGS2-2 TaxID=3349631 RepID=UPI0036D22262
MTIGFLTCPGTHPGSPNRRKDAFEHDLQVAALRPAIEAAGMELREIEWRAPDTAFDDIRLVLIGTPWDYQDHEAEFLGKLDTLAARGIAVCNPPELVRWNTRKTYLRELEEAGAATIPTLWHERLTRADLSSAFDRLGADRLVVKRQVGANAEGQHLFNRSDDLPPDWSLDMPVMVQPFLPAIAETGETSFLFIDGEFSHAAVKRPAQGDYRVQSEYGGTEEMYDPTAAERTAAAAIIAALPHLPLYARIDMVRGETGLLLMEAELIEPFLYPNQGPELGPRMAAGITRRLGQTAR